uniref:Uncharacterized protein n=1 Tax=Phakopsora pachyrhizi TaxID=170000 RepID=A0A0S1MIZ6_PHAPC
MCKTHVLIGTISSFLFLVMCVNLVNAVEWNNQHF